MKKILPTPWAGRHHTAKAYFKLQLTLMTLANRGAMKTLDELMQHLCDNGIACSGELQKRELKNLGYYHGYKGVPIRWHCKESSSLAVLRANFIIEFFWYGVEIFNLPSDHRRGNRFEELHIGRSSSRCRVTISGSCVVFVGVVSSLSRWLWGCEGRFL